MPVLRPVLVLPGALLHARGYACAEEAPRLDAAAVARGWLKLSMPDDFATVFTGKAR